MSECLSGRMIRVKSEIGFLVDARVLADPDPLGDRGVVTTDESPLLCELIGVVHPDDQTEKYRKHARTFSGMSIPAGDEIFNSPRPSDDNEVRVIDESDVWDDGRYVLEKHDPERFERLEHITKPLPENYEELAGAQAVRRMEKGDSGRL